MQFTFDSFAKKPIENELCMNVILFFIEILEVRL